MTKLKPCPFCGGAGRILTHLTEDKFTIECLGCGMRLRWFGSGEEAMESWNRRVTDWHTGTPTEEGEYLCWVSFAKVCKDADGSWRCRWKDGKWYDNDATDNLSMDDLGFEVIAWQKSEPLKEENNGTISD